MFLGLKGTTGAPGAVTPGAPVNPALEDLRTSCQPHDVRRVGGAALVTAPLLEQAAYLPHAIRVAETQGMRSQTVVSVGRWLLFRGPLLSSTPS